MDLYGRKTAVEPSAFVKKKYQYFNSRDAPLAGSDRVWALAKSDSFAPENVECRPMTWGGKLGSLTARVKLGKNFTCRIPLKSALVVLGEECRWLHLCLPVLQSKIETI